jgi:hypothetical protein
MRLYGRSRELGALGQRLEFTAGERGQVVFVEGEAGIGKTRLVAEAVATAEDQGFRVFQAGAEELEATRPFGVLADALGCQRRSPDPARATIGQLLTGRANGSGDEQAGGNGAGLQFVVVEAFVELVEQLATAGPVMLVLEDLHWGDASSLLAVRVLGKRLVYAPVALVGTFRPVPRRGELERLAAACADEGGLHLRLEPLDDTAVTELAAEAVGAPSGPRLREQLSGAGGNPLFVLELVRALHAEGAIQMAGGQAEVSEVALPPTLRLTILRRLSVLSEATLELLRVASVLGSTLSLADLSTVAHRPAAQLLPALQEALAASLVGEAGTQLVFRHELVREAIYQDLPLAVRTGLHRDAGRALAAAGAPTGQVATHMALGASAGDIEAVEWLRRAARQAAPRAPSVAAELLGRAVTLIDAPDPARDELQVEQINALVWSGHVAEAEALARRLLEGHLRPDAEASLRLYLGRALTLQGEVQHALMVLETATCGLTNTDEDRTLLQATAAWPRALSGDLDGAQTAGAAASAEAERLGNDVAWCTAAGALSAVALFRGHLDDAVSLAVQVMERAQRSPHPEARDVVFHQMLVLSFIWADRLEEAAEASVQGLRASQQRGSVWQLPHLQYSVALRNFLAGAWNDAAAEAEAAVTITGEVGARLISVAGHSLLALIAVHRGQSETAQNHFRTAEGE